MLKTRFTFHLTPISKLIFWYPGGDIEPIGYNENNSKVGRKLYFKFLKQNFVAYCRGFKYVVIFRRKHNVVGYWKRRTRSIEILLLFISKVAYCSCENLEIMRFQPRVTSCFRPIVSQSVCRLVEFITNPCTQIAQMVRVHGIVTFLSLNQGNQLFRIIQINSDSWPTERKKKSCSKTFCDWCGSVVDSAMVWYAVNLAEKVSNPARYGSS